MTRASILVTAVLLIACKGKNPGSYETLANDGAAVSADAVAKADALWDDRADINKLKAAVAAYEAIATKAPTDRHALTRATRGWYFIADAHIEDSDEKIATYLKAVEWGKRCMAVNTDFAKKIEDGEKEKDAASLLTKADVKCTYWTASALGKWAKASGLSKSIRHLPTVKAYVSKVEELEPTYYHHGPSRYWGAYYSIVPSFAGRDLDKSASYFEDTMKGSPNYLGSRVLRAENLAVGLGNVQMFDDDLKFVLAFDLSKEPGLLAENTAEQAKATKLIAKRGDFFDKKALEAAGN